MQQHTVTIVLPTQVRLDLTKSDFNDLIVEQVVLWDHIGHF